MAGRNSHIEMNKVMVGDVVCIGISGEQSRTGHCPHVQKPGLTHSFQQPLTNFPVSLGHSYFICYMRRMEFLILSHCNPPSNPENHKLANDGIHPRKGHDQNTDSGPGTYINHKSSTGDQPGAGITPSMKEGKYT